VSTAQAGAGSGQVYALLADGTTVGIRPAGPGDLGAVKAMHEALSPGSTYMRFFNLSRTAAGTGARRICRVPSPTPACPWTVMSRTGSSRRPFLSLPLPRPPLPAVT
jgi:hypothetical protein